MPKHVMPKHGFIQPCMHGCSAGDGGQIRQAHGRQQAASMVECHKILSIWPNASLQGADERLQAPSMGVSETTS